ncbi:hypothetical protein KGM_201507 [Danaus plexippus plexippus]|uniref:Uncharacterized protein n=1 Tax=Danaus plexippus plexippus TaxID=278856 RepID=A0A212EL08_DANPL|nr:hypothetical protein KGM_201507 [Danaus plexippus plexippus]
MSPHAPLTSSIDIRFELEDHVPNIHGFGLAAAAAAGVRAGYPTVLPAHYGIASVSHQCSMAQHFDICQHKRRRMPLQLHLTRQKSDLLTLDYSRDEASGVSGRLATWQPAAHLD